MDGPQSPQPDTSVATPAPPSGHPMVTSAKAADGSIEKYKARLVTQGFTQVLDMDYSTTSSPVVKASTVLVILSLAVLNKWHLHQSDVKNAFLNGNLMDTVYIEQPPGFVDTSRADTSLFVFKKDAFVLYLLVYVADIILTGNNATLLRYFISRLHKEFHITDLGKLGYFFGLEVSYHDSGIFLSQSKYAHDILARAQLLDIKPSATSLSTSAYFTSQGKPYSDPTQYHSLVGALQYLTITRLDLSYAVNHVSQFLHAPTQEHFQGVKRILRYVKGMLSYGLSFLHSPTPTILGYSDANWARCIETRRSTYGYSVFLGGNLVSWSAKKQPTVSRSSCESEYHALANTATEIIWLTHLLKELHVLPSV
ncbi:uncharacterized mitochondrial protein AtMg00810-like [Rutidosis leptorrhynchoides]|uniref:uncharacterized mitochondrial protein AtMg00810-like n=1 Tax=Rutidosis leptorrhynchoides TaxID=125765 RepID=UPI003A98F885